VGGCRGAILSLLLEAGVVLVETLFDGRHELLVVVLEPYYARTRCAYCCTLEKLLASCRRRMRTLSYINVCARKAVKGSQARVHIDAVL
jgi:hypothetical protein